MTSALTLIPEGPRGPGGWSCHTFEDGETFPLICLADDCPDRSQRNPRRFHGEVLLSVDAEDAS